VFRLLLAFWRGDGFVPDEPEKADVPQEQTVELLPSDERGQTIVEYAVLLVWLTLFFVGLIGAVSSGTKKIWVTANSNLSQANVIAKGQ
jgi:Flp pilus assembly pilin Flp